MRHLYHATSSENLTSILENGLNPGPDGQVYLCERPNEAIRFIAYKGLESIAVFEVVVPEEKVHETFDHSYEFFKCRAYGHLGPIPKEKIIDCDLYGKNTKT